MNLSSIEINSLINTEKNMAKIIKIDPEYSNLVNTLSRLEYESLKSSIKENGLHLPIIINSNNIILDGHHRYKICQELGIETKIEVVSFKDKFEEKLFVIDSNVKRRQLNNFQTLELEYKKEEIYKERAKQRQSEAGKNRGRGMNNNNNNNSNNSIASFDANLSTNEGKGKVSEIIAKKLRISPRTYERAKTIIEYGSAEQKKRLEEGKSTINKEYEKIRRDRKRLELLSKINNTDNIENHNSLTNNYCRLFHGDFTELQNKILEDNSIDLIFTDPPYGTESLLLYRELAKLAARVLKPGASLIFFVGHIILDQVIRILNDFSLTDNNDNNINSINLKYWWTLAVKHSGHHTKIHPRYVFAEWKPLLWYVKGDKANDLIISNTIGDYIESVTPLKIEHKWQQSTVEAEYVIKNLTIEHQTVLDPMMGTGTTALATLNLRRKFIGIEKNLEIFEIARIRINKQQFERIKEKDD